MLPDVPPPSVVASFLCNCIAPTAESYNISVTATEISLTWWPQSFFSGPPTNVTIPLGVLTITQLQEGIESLPDWTATAPLNDTGPELATTLTEAGYVDGDPPLAFAILTAAAPPA